VYSEPSDINSYGIRVGLAGQLNYSKNESQENILLTLTDLRVSSRRPLEQKYHLSDVLSPCSLQLQSSKRGFDSILNECTNVTIDKMTIRCAPFFF
jgi:hypothetical protein